MKYLLIACACVALSACATAPTTTGQGLSAAQDSIAAAAAGVHQAYVSGVVSKAQVASAAKLVDKADDISKAARAAYVAGDSSSYAGAIAQLNALVTQIVALEKPQ